MSTVAALSAGTLYFFDPAAPAVAVSKVKITGLAKKEQLVGIDFRPTTGQLYGLGSASHLYTIDPTTGRATDANPQGQAFDPPLAGSAFGVGFSPVSDLLRVISDADMNFRLYAPTGIVIDYDEATPGTQTDVAVSYTDTDPHAGANPDIQGVAYARLSGDGNSTAYGIDADTRSLVRIGSVDEDADRRNSGKLTTLGALGVDAAGPVGFDIDTNGSADVAYASFGPSAPAGLSPAAAAKAAKFPSTLYTVNLTTGAATAVGAIKASKLPVTAIAVVPTGHTILAADAKNRLVRVDSNLPNVATSQVTVSGLAAKEKLVAVCQRPTDGAVFAFTSGNRLYTVDPTTGAAAAVGSGPTEVPLRKGAKVAMDYDPGTGQIRVVDSVGENLRLDPATGQVVDADPQMAGTQIDTPLVYASTDQSATAKPNVTGLAVVPGASGNTGGAPATGSTVYGLDAGRDALVTVGSPGGTTSPIVGQVFTVGKLGVDAADPATFDVRTETTAGTTASVAFAAFKAKGGKLSLFRVDLATGAVSTVGLLPKDISPIGIVILS